MKRLIKTFINITLILSLAAPPGLAGGVRIETLAPRGWLQRVSQRDGEMAGLVVALSSWAQQQRSHIELDDMEDWFKGHKRYRRKPLTEIANPHTERKIGLTVSTPKHTMILYPEDMNEPGDDMDEPGTRLPNSRFRYYVIPRIDKITKPVEINYIFHQADNIKMAERIAAELKGLVREGRIEGELRSCIVWERLEDSISADTLYLNPIVFFWVQRILFREYNMDKNLRRELECRLLLSVLFRYCTGLDPAFRRQLEEFVCECMELDNFQFLANADRFIFTKGLYARPGLLAMVSTILADTAEAINEQIKRSDVDLIPDKHIWMDSCSQFYGSLTGLRQVMNEFGIAQDFTDPGKIAGRIMYYRFRALKICDLSMLLKEVRDALKRYRETGVEGLDNILGEIDDAVGRRGTLIDFSEGELGKALADCFRREHRKADLFPHSQDALYSCGNLDEVRDFFRNEALRAFHRDGVTLFEREMPMDVLGPEVPVGDVLRAAVEGLVQAEEETGYRLQAGLVPCIAKNAYSILGGTERVIERLAERSEMSLDEVEARILERIPQSDLDRMKEEIERELGRQGGSVTERKIRSQLIILYEAMKEALVQVCEVAALRQEYVRGYALGDTKRRSCLAALGLIGDEDPYTQWVTAPALRFAPGSVMDCSRQDQYIDESKPDRVSARFMKLWLKNPEMTNAKIKGVIIREHQASRIDRQLKRFNKTKAERLGIVQELIEDIRNYLPVVFAICESLEREWNSEFADKIHFVESTLAEYDSMKERHGIGRAIDLMISRAGFLVPMLVELHDYAETIITRDDELYNNLELFKGYSSYLIMLLQEIYVRNIRAQVLEEIDLADIGRILRDQLSLRSDLLDVEFDIPEDVEGVLVQSREIDILRVFAKLITCCVTTIRRKTGADFKGKIKISASVDDDKLKVTIEDNGSGVPEELLSRDSLGKPRLFEKHRVSESSQYLEQGLGLDYVWDMVTQEWFGEVKVTSVEDVGSTFSLEIPKVFEDTESVQETPSVERAPGAKFRGLPADEDVVLEVLDRSTVETVSGDELDDVERQLDELFGKSSKIPLPEGFPAAIMAEVFKLKRAIDGIDIDEGKAEKLVKARGALAKLFGKDWDVGKDRRLMQNLSKQKGKLEARVKEAQGYELSKLPKEISLRMVRDLFRTLKEGGKFVKFTPRREQDLEYFMASPDQHTSAVLRGRVCCFFKPVWEDLDSIEDSDLKRRLKSAFVMHEVVEEFLCEQGLPHLISHYIAEIFERFILGEKEPKLEGDSELDEAIKAYFERPWMELLLGGKLKTFAEGVPHDELMRAKRRCKSPVGVVELIQRLQNPEVRRIFNLTEGDLTTLAGVFRKLYLTSEPEQAELSQFFSSFSGDKYELPALLSLYIDAKCREAPAGTVEEGVPSLPSVGGFLSVDTSQIDTTKPREHTTTQIIVEEQGDGFSGILHGIADAFSERTGQRLDRERLVKAMENVTHTMKTKTRQSVEGFLNDVRSNRQGGIEIVFSSNNPGLESLFNYNRTTGQIKVNLSILEKIEDPEVIEMLIAVGLIGHLLLGYNEENFKELYGLHGFAEPKIREERDMTREGVFRRFDVESTSYVFAQYEITPANFIFGLSKVAAKGEEYPEAVISRFYAPQRLPLTSMFRDIKCKGDDMSGVVNYMRTKLYSPNGRMEFVMAQGGAVSPEDCKMLADALSQEILSVYIPPEERIGFTSDFSEALNYALRYSFNIAWNPSWREGRWTIGWKITPEYKVTFWIEYPIIEKREHVPDSELAGLKDLFDEVGIEDRHNSLWDIHTETLKVVTDIPEEGIIERFGRPVGVHAGFIGNGIPSSEVTKLTPVRMEEVSAAINNIEYLLGLKRADKRFVRHITEIEKYIARLRKLAEQGKIFKFDAIVKGPEEFLLGFADSRGIAFCNEFFEEGTDLNKVLDEALFHEVYHLYRLGADPRAVHNEARILQEQFFDDEIHYVPDPVSGVNVSRLGDYARMFINERCEGPKIDIRESEEEAGLFYIFSDYKDPSGEKEIEGCVKVQIEGDYAHIMLCFKTEHSPELLDNNVFNEIIWAIAKRCGLGSVGLVVHSNQPRPESEIPVGHLSGDWERYLEEKLLAELMNGRGLEQAEQLPKARPSKATQAIISLGGVAGAAAGMQERATEDGTVIEVGPADGSGREAVELPVKAASATRAIASPPGTVSFRDGDTGGRQRAETRMLPVHTGPVVRNVSGTDQGDFLDISEYPDPTIGATSCGKGTSRDPRKSYFSIARSVSSQLLGRATGFIFEAPCDETDTDEAQKLCNNFIAAMDSILNLPDSKPGIAPFKKTVIASFSSVRLEKRQDGRIYAGMELVKEMDGSQTLVFKLPYDRFESERIGEDNFVFCLMYFFSFCIDGRQTRLGEIDTKLLLNPQLGTLATYPKYYELYKWARDEIERQRKTSMPHYILQVPSLIEEHRRPLEVTVDSESRVTARLTGRVIPLFLLERHKSGYRDCALGRRESQGRGFKGYIKDGIPGSARFDPGRGEVQEKYPKPVEIPIDLYEDRGVMLPQEFWDKISGIKELHEGDRKAIEEIIHGCFRRRVKLFDKEGDLLRKVLDKLKRRPFSLHFIDEELGSRSLFGDHAPNGLGWVNMPALGHLVEKIEDERLKTFILGIILGIGLSHEILGHESGIRGDELLTLQDAILTVELIRAINNAFSVSIDLSYYIGRLEIILESGSPYIKQLKAINGLTGPGERRETVILWDEDVAEDNFRPADVIDGVISNMTLGVLENIDEPGKFAIFSHAKDAEDKTKEIGNFVITWKNGTPYIQLDFEKPYSFLMLSSGETIGRLVGAITEKFGLDIYRVQVEVKKSPVDVIPVRAEGERVVLVPVVRTGDIEEIPVDIERLKGAVPTMTMKGRSVKGFPEEDERPFFSLSTSSFSLEMMETERFSADKAGDLFHAVLDALSKIQNFQTNNIGLKERLNSVKTALMQDISTVAFISSNDLPSGTELFLELEEEKRLVVYFNDTAALGLFGQSSVDILTYVFLEFFLLNELCRRFAEISEIALKADSVGEEGESEVEKLFYEIIGDEQEPRYYRAQFGEDINIEFSARGKIGRIEIGGEVVLPFWAERALPELRDVLAAQPINISLSRDLEPRVETGVQDFRVAQYTLGRSGIRLAESPKLGKRVLGQTMWWEGLYTIFNLSGNIPEAEAFKEWIASLDSIIFDLYAGEGVDISLEEDEEQPYGRHLIVKIPAKLKGRIRQELLIANIMSYFLQSKGGPTIASDCISEETSTRRQRGKPITVDVGYGLIVDIDSWGWISVKKDGQLVPIILMEKAAPGFRKFILGLPGVAKQLKKVSVGHSGARPVRPALRDTGEIDSHV